ncbi:MAG: hypothetical protein Q9184_000211 [Pyrenodesmia sp. 2 TL-2023]
MGKPKKLKHNRSPQVPYSKDTKPHQSRTLTKTPLKSKSQKLPQPPPTIPFAPTDRILLVGEGDFSFAHSLYNHHNCSSVVATCYDTAVVLAKKYPQATLYIRKLEDAARADEDVDFEILYGIDATKLGKGGMASGGKAVKKGGFDRVVFNFPHVGGLTKDVNRQVRHNQELLVNFFKAAMPLLAPTGTIIVTIFEGEPYSLWNIRDLGRHVGLQVGRSFKFKFDSYPGYRHARTLGNTEGGGGWKGEDRDARTYIFERKDAEATHAQQRKHNKRKTESSDSDQDD